LYYSYKQFGFTYLLYPSESSIRKNMTAKRFDAGIMLSATWMTMVRMVAMAGRVSDCTGIMMMLMLHCIYTETVNYVRTHRERDVGEREAGEAVAV
jgi:hypothetical protein